MAQIVKSENGYWVGKELYKGEQYISFDDKRAFHPIEKIVVVDRHVITNDILQHFGVRVLPDASDEIISVLSKELCHSKNGVCYLLDYRAPFGVRKIIDAPKI